MRDLAKASGACSKLKCMCEHPAARSKKFPKFVDTKFSRRNVAL